MQKFYGLALWNQPNHERPLGAQAFLLLEHTDVEKEMDWKDEAQSERFEG
jgi:hypothetical protein